MIYTHPCISKRELSLLPSEPVNFTLISTHAIVPIDRKVIAGIPSAKVHLILIIYLVIFFADTNQMLSQ